MRFGWFFAAAEAELRDSGDLDDELLPSAPGLSADGCIPPPMGVLDEDGDDDDDEPKELKKEEARDAAVLAVLVGDVARDVPEEEDEVLDGALALLLVVAVKPSSVSRGVSRGFPSRPLTILSSPSRRAPTNSRKRVRR